jgi:hypothetical protein
VKSLNGVSQFLKLIAGGARERKSKERFKRSIAGMHTNIQDRRSALKLRIAKTNTMLVIFIKSNCEHEM